MTKNVSLEDAYDHCPAHDVDFNAKVERESIYRPTFGQFSLQEKTNENGLRLIDYAAGRNMVIKRTCFRHR